MLERGAYRDLLDAFYDAEEPLPIEERLLFDLVGAVTVKEQEAVRKVLSRKWKLTDRGYIQTRAMAEVENQREKRGKLAANGKIGGVAKHQQLLKDKLAIAGNCQANATLNLATLVNHQPSAISQEPSAKSQEPAAPGELASRDGIPTLEVALRWAESFSEGNAYALVISAQMVREWYDARSIANWERPMGQHMRPIADWQADLRDFTKWKGGSEKKGGTAFSPPVGKSNPLDREPSWDWPAGLAEVLAIGAEEAGSLASMGWRQVPGDVRERLLAWHEKRKGGGI